MIEPIPDKLARALQQTLARGERVFVQLRGAFQEALVCADYRVIIVKGGWMTGQWFGTDLFQCPYANVAGAQVTFHLLTGYFELSAGGMQNTSKSFWNSDTKISAAKAPNCVAISGRERADRFRAACAFIMHRANYPASNPPVNAMITTLQELAKLRDRGVISEAEFRAKKSEILSRI